jgi:MFS family permease
MRERLPTGDMARLLWAWLLIGSSGWAFVVAIAVYAYVRDGAGAVAVISVARLIPAMLVAPLAGDLLDRAQRDRIAALFSLVQAASMAGVAILVIADASLLAILVLVAIGGAAATAPRPALQTMMPALAGSPEELTRATAWWGALDSVGFLLGSGLGGIAIAAFEPGPVIAASAVLCALAAALAIALPATTATGGDEEDEQEEGIWASAVGGFRALREIPALRTPIFLFTGLLILEGTTDVQLVALALEDLDMGEGGPGIIYAAWGAGGIVGSALILWLLRRRGYGLAMWLGVLVLGVTLGLAGADGVALALALMVPAGLGFSLVETAAMGLVPRLADDAIAGRIYGLYEVLYAGATAVGALIAPPLISLTSVGGSLAIIGGAYALMGIFAWWALARLDEGQEEASRVRELFRRVSFLRPLPLPRLERLVRNSRPASLSAGTEIITRGEPGEDFYVIEQGTVDIVEYGRSQGPDEGFGEIALLKDIPRTATVRAATHVRLRVLGRKAFLGAITADGDASAMASSVVDEHLARPMVGDAKKP